MGGSSSQRPGHISVGGVGVLHRRLSVLKEGMQGVAAPKGPGTLASGYRESCPSGGRCPRRACGVHVPPHPHKVYQGPGELWCPCRCEGKLELWPPPSPLPAAFFPRTSLGGL